MTQPIAAEPVTSRRELMHVICNARAVKASHRCVKRGSQETGQYRDPEQKILMLQEKCQEHPTPSLEAVSLGAEETSNFELESS